MPSAIIKINLYIFLVGLTLFPASLSWSREVTDEIGRSVNVSPRVRRIVSLAPGITETLYALGLEDKIVGVTTFCDWPARAAEKEKVGGFINPSLEKIVSLRPDLILATADGNRKDTVRQLERMGLAVYVTNPSDTSGILRGIGHIGEITGQKQQAARLAAQLRRRLDDIAAQIKGKEKPRVFFQLGLEPVISAGGGTLINEAIERAGGINVAGQSAARYPRFSAEGIAAARPDIILLAPMRGDKELKAAKAFWEKLSVITAVQQGRIYAVDTDLIGRASPRIVDAIEQMALIFHPEIKIRKKTED
ncbi:MAG TPA: cobalamin-binding protein [Smithellaceae bacterium]|nr:cobalamin-binding protein [Smithellaceae bacterium]HRS89333.1 cobalamin-binding protein [Smithellaceae bacterium]HRV26823.1 cobalamin-binding protein [Smithellaceae bacterium]